MLEMYLVVLSVFFIGLSIKLFYELCFHKKYVKSIFSVVQNFFLVFCIIFLINLLSISIIRNVSHNASNIDIQELASTIENYDINNIAKK
ncbi:MAG: hypothetical protein LBH40_07075 [Alphaproteobacteria bacterium]|jgi:quinol-cytochrome oxidoreductase complex cytochrome b subunit|nr:hypothetical protein [Alphaproteobacteria bacterium]